MSHDAPLVDDPFAISEARIAAGRAIRDLGHSVVGHHVPDVLLGEVADMLNALTGRLDACPQRVRDPENFQSRNNEPNVQDGETFATYADRPYSGASSPLGLDLQVVRTGDEVTAHFVLRSAHEGAPTRSHGGIVSAVIDDVFGFVLQLHQLRGFTGELTVRYEAGTPIGHPLQLRARMDRKEGRKIFMTGDLWDGETRTASARAIFIERTDA
jgi:hypothetical protein